MDKKSSLNAEDLVQVVVGASALSVPVAFSEESWRLSETLPLFNVICLIVLSLLFISLYAMQGIFQGDVKSRISDFFLRTFIIYFMTVLVVFIVLLVLNRMPLLEDSVVAIKRIILLSFPASMGGVIVDGFDKE